MQLHVLIRAFRAPYNSTYNPFDSILLRMPQRHCILCKIMLLYESMNKKSMCLPINPEVQYGPISRLCSVQYGDTVLCIMLSFNHFTFLCGDWVIISFIC